MAETAPEVKTEETNGAAETVAATTSVTTTSVS